MLLPFLKGKKVYILFFLSYKNSIRAIFLKKIIIDIQSVELEIFRYLYLDNKKKKAKHYKYHIWTFCCKIHYMNKSLFWIPYKLDLNVNYSLLKLKFN